MVALYVILTLDAYTALRAEVLSTEAQIQNYARKIPSKRLLTQQRDALAEQIAQEERHFYRRSETDPYRFGDMVRGMLSAANLTINRYQTIEIGDRIYHEFSVSGDTKAFFTFLDAVSAFDRHLAVPSVKIVSSDDRAVAVVFRITYEAIA